MSLHPGTVIQNYRLVRFLGDGGMGTVWLAEHTHLDRKVAIKCLHTQYARNAGIRARFKQEAATLAMLQHPGIVALHDYIEDDEGAFLVMEYVDGLPLDEHIQKVSGPIPAPKLREMFGQILEGFIYAHGKMIVHRDIKPSNFLVTAAGKVKILDFGIAKILTDHDRKLTKTGMNMGTVYYMSPEQVKGEAVDVRSDVYSLGVTLFQMATGRCPYPQETTEFYVYDQIVNHPLPAASEFYPGVPASIEAAIAKATAKRPEDRFQDCVAFLKALKDEEFGDNSEEKEEEVEATPLPEPIPVSTPLPTPTQISPELTPSSEPGLAPVSAPLPQQLPPRPPQRKRKRGWVWGLVLFSLIVGGGFGVVWKMGFVGLQSETMWVVPEDLHLWKKARVGAVDGVDDLGRIPFGSEIKVLNAAENGWKQVEWAGKQGFVNGYYLVPLDEIEVIKHAMNDGVKTWFDKSYLRISLAQYFHDSDLKADLPLDVFRKVYGMPKERQPLWSAKAIPGTSEYNTVIKGMQLEEGPYPKNRLPDNVIILEQRGVKPYERRLVAFKHVKVGEAYESKVLATLDLDKYPDRSIRIAAKDKLMGYSFDEKWNIIDRIDRGQFPILLADPKNDRKATLLLLENGRFKEYSIEKPWF
ncbi:MAG: hypothetical protein RLZZ519_2409 [Bacteroidota bacterium]